MPKDKGGFASLTLEERRAIARKGGNAPHKSRKGFHTMTHEQRVAAGRKGGKSTKKKGVYTVSN